MAVAESLHITNTMQTAAKAVTVSHQHYVENCTIMSQLKGKPDAMVVAIQERKKAHAAYHMALGFLREATIQANSSLQALASHPQSVSVAEQVDTQLNALIYKGVDGDVYDHRIIRENEDWRWE